jgi:hypothetical protein
LLRGEAGQRIVELRHLKPADEAVGPLTLKHDNRRGTTEVHADAAEDAGAPDAVAVVVAALREQAPQGQEKLVKVLREAGVKGRDSALRKLVKTMAEDPACPVRDTDGDGFDLDPDTPWPDPMAQGYGRGPYRGGATAPGGDDGQTELIEHDRAGGHDFSGTQPKPREPDDDHERRDIYG